MRATTTLHLTAKGLAPLPADLRAARAPLLETLRDETETEIGQALLVWEVLGGLDDAPGHFECLVRNIGPASTEFAYEITTPRLGFHVEFLEHMSESGQSSVCARNVREFRGLPAGVAIDVRCDHALYPTFTALIRGVSHDTAERICRRVRGVFTTVTVVSE